MGKKNPFCRRDMGQGIDGHDRSATWFFLLASEAELCDAESLAWGPPKKKKKKKMKNEKKK
jgi:hypothetical protein